LVAQFSWFEAATLLKLRAYISSTAPPLKPQYPHSYVVRFPSCIGAIGAAMNRCHIGRDMKVCFSAMAENFLEQWGSDIHIAIT
ncbi:unnamed protein product, partial [Urochloa humidicola]